MHPSDYLPDWLAFVPVLLLCNIVGRITFLLLPALPSRISFLRLVNVIMVGGLVETVALAILAVSYGVMCRVICLIWGPAAADRHRERWEKFRIWVMSFVDKSYVHTAMTMLAGPLGLAFTGPARDDNYPGLTMLYLALLGFVGTMVVALMLLEARAEEERERPQHGATRNNDLRRLFVFCNEQPGMRLVITADPARWQITEASPRLVPTTWRVIQRRRSFESLRFRERNGTTVYVV